MRQDGGGMVERVLLVMWREEQTAESTPERGSFPIKSQQGKGKMTK